MINSSGRKRSADVAGVGVGKFYGRRSGKMRNASHLCGDDDDLEYVCTVDLFRLSELRLKSLPVSWKFLRQKSRVGC